MDRRIESSDTDEHRIDLPRADQVPNGPPGRRRQISTELPPREDPFNSPPSLAPGQAAEITELEAIRQPTSDYDATPLDAYGQLPESPGLSEPNLGGAYNERPVPFNHERQLEPVAVPNRNHFPAPPIVAQSDTAPTSRRRRRLLLPALGLIVIGALILFFGRSNGSDQEVALDNGEASAPQSTELATPSTLETKIVDLDEVAEEDTMRLEIPLETSGATSDPDIEVDLSLPPLKFTIADGKVRLSGTAQTEEQAIAMTERAALVFAGVELVADYQVNPRAPSPVSGVVVQKPVVFQTGSAVIRPEYYPVLDACADVLQSQPSLVMTVAGHTDNVGSSQINLALAEQRAQAVIDYYVASGLDREQFEQVALGDLAPIATNETAEGRQDNRRTDLEFEGIFEDVIQATDE